MSPAQTKTLLERCSKLSRDDVLWKLADLHKQATTDRSHFYTGSVIVDAIVEIVSLRTAADNI